MAACLVAKCSVALTRQKPLLASSAHVLQCAGAEEAARAAPDQVQTAEEQQPPALRIAEDPGQGEISADRTGLFGRAVIPDLPLLQAKGTPPAGQTTSVTSVAIEDEPPLLEAAQAHLEQGGTNSWMEMLLQELSLDDEDASIDLIKVSPGL